METTTDAIADQLIAIIDEVRQEFFCLDESEVERPAACGKWSAKQVIGHLIDSALNNHQRIVRAQQSEHTIMAGYEQDFWMNANAYQDRSWEDVIVLWRKFNRFLAEVIRNVPPAALANKLTIGDDDAVSLEFVIEDYVRHVRHHLTQVRHLCK